MNSQKILFIYFNMKKLAIVGATGLVGQTVLRVLKEENLIDKFEINLIVSNKSAGKVMVFNDKHYQLIELSNDVFELGFDYAIFLTSEDISREWIPKFVKVGTKVIDNSCAFRMDKDVPLVVPEINLGDIKKTDKFIANPNCSTIQLVVCLDRLRENTIKKVIVSSYQSVSGAGKEALFDLEEDTNNVFECGIKDNVIAKIGDINKNGYSSEENKIMNETLKILHNNFDIYATAVRVPISFCHGESVYVEFEKPIDLNLIKKQLSCDYLLLTDELFYPKNCKGTNLTYICRLRKAGKKAIQFFVIADNLRRGAAYNAVKILEKIDEI